MLFSILGIMLDFVHEEDEQDGGNGTLLQYPCLENSMDRGALVGYNSCGRKVSGHD